MSHLYYKHLFRASHMFCSAHVTSNISTSTDSTISRDSPRNHQDVAQCTTLPSFTPIYLNTKYFTLHSSSLPSVRARTPGEGWDGRSTLNFPKFPPNPTSARCLSRKRQDIAVQVWTSDVTRLWGLLWACSGMGGVRWYYCSRVLVL